MQAERTGTADGQTYRRGFLLHPALVVDPATRQVMGLGAQELWARKEGKKKRVHRVACRKRPTEAEVWGRIIDRVQSTVAGVRFIHLCDRGADNFDVFAHLFQKGDSWVIRAAQLTHRKTPLHCVGYSILPNRCPASPHV